MKKYIKLLIESLFDDDFDDIMSQPDEYSGDDEDITNELGNIYITKIKDILKTCHIQVEWDTAKTVDVELSSDKQTLALYTIDSGTKEYITHITFGDQYHKKENNIDKTQEFFDAAAALGIKYFAFSVNINPYRYAYGKLDIHDIDLKNIMPLSLELSYIHCTNISYDYKAILSNTFIRYINDYVNKDRGTYNRRDLFGFNNVKFNECIIEQNSISINAVSRIDIINCKNIKDFSFILYIDKSISLTYNEPNTRPECHSLQGLPNNAYSINIDYPDTDTDLWKNTTNIPVESFKGVPSACGNLTCRINVLPSIILQYISFEGLELSMIDKFDFKARKFPGQRIARHILMGPFKIDAKCRAWTPTKPLLTTVIKVQDWFLDCYKDVPNKEYTPPANDTSNKEISAALKKAAAANLKKEDDKEDALKIIDNIKQYISVGDQFINLAGTITYEVIEVYNDDKFVRKLDDYALAVKKVGYPRLNYPYKYKEFVKKMQDWGLKFVSGKYKGRILFNLIVKPILDNRAKIKDERKQKEKEERLKAKETIQKETNTEVTTTEPKKRGRKPKVLVTEEPSTQVSPVITKTPKSNSNIHICDYNDRSIAIYGNTWEIKDKLKELGCRYNKFLTIDGKKTPGWIISNKKRAEVEALI